MGMKYGAEQLQQVFEGVKGSYSGKKMIPACDCYIHLPRPMRSCPPDGFLMETILELKLWKRCR